MAITSEIRDADEFATCDANCAADALRLPRSLSSRRRSSSHLRGWRCSSRAGAVGTRGGRARITADGELVQASRPRRGPHRGRGRPLARIRGAGDRRGRSARRDPDRQGDRRDPVAVRGTRAEDPRRGRRDRAGRHRARRHRRAGRGAAATICCKPRRARGPRATSDSCHKARALVPRGRVQATPVVRRIAQELGVDLAVGCGDGPRRSDHRGRRARRSSCAARPRADASRCAASAA